MSGPMKWCVLSVFACLALTLGACGGEGGDSDVQSQKVVRSKGNEPPRTFVERVAKLLATTKEAKECKAIALINGRSYTRFRCPPSAALARSMAKLEVMAAEEHGTGAVVEYRSGKEPDGATVLLFADDNRDWAISKFGVLTEPSVGTDDGKSRAGYDRAVEEYLAAVRERDCRAFATVAYTDDETGDAVCRGTFAKTKALAKQLKADPEAEPRYQGGNATFGFYVLNTAKPKPRRGTISVARAGSGADASYVVLDYAAPVTINVQQ